MISLSFVSATALSKSAFSSAANKSSQESLAFFLRVVLGAAVLRVLLVVFCIGVAPSAGDIVVFLVLLTGFDVDGFEVV